MNETSTDRSHQSSMFCHGEARVWLIPDESESRVSYVILLREDDSKTGV
jgi:hypothetical protein